MGEKDKQEQTYRLPGVQAEDGSTGTLVFTVKPGGNAHAEFEVDEEIVEAPPEAQQLPAQEQAGPPTPAQPEQAPPTAEQQPAETPAGAQQAPTPPPGT